jgi:hypothetical protein
MILEIVLFHHNDSCPIVQGRSDTHDICWRLRPKDPDDIWIDRLFSQPLSAEHIYELLSNQEILEGKIEYSVKLFHVPKKDDPGFCVFHEESWIRSLFRKYGVNLKPVLPGAFLQVNEQKWIVDFSIQQ